jgi:hypothetical protein
MILGWLISRGIGGFRGMILTGSANKSSYHW